MKDKLNKRNINTVSIGLLFYDIFAVNFAYLVALWLRFDCQYSSIPLRYLEPAFKIIPLHTLVMLIALASMRLYQSVWRYASLPEMLRVLTSSGISVVFQVICTVLIYRRMPISYYFIGWMLTFGALVVSRFGYRALKVLYRKKHKKMQTGKNVMIIGAGEAGK